MDELLSASSLLSAEEMSRADRLAVARGIASFDLMRRAGEAIAAKAQAMAPKGRIVVVAGPGNNGGDGFIAARALRAAGREVEVMLHGAPHMLKGDASRATTEWGDRVLPLDADAFVDAGLIIDALFGAGLDRPLTGDAAWIVDAMNAQSVPVLAVDLPSGINGTSGAMMGCAVKARATLTFFRRKTGHLLLPGRLHCGALEVADIGIPDAVLDDIRPQAFANEPNLWGRQFPIPRAEGHKYTRGHALVLSGGLASTGAARLAARGALRIGAGLVTIGSPMDALAVNAASNLAVMVKPIETPQALKDWLADRRHNVCVMGPGLGVGEATCRMVEAAVKSEAALVLDADALTSFADEPERLFDALVARAARGSQVPVILTPHEGEFIRLFSAVGQKSQPQSKLERARRAAAHAQAIVVLKGADSVAAMPDGRASIAQNAPPYLATAGSGDVLAGFIGGLLAQGMDGFAGVSAAIWLHGETAKAFGPGLISEDLPEVLPGVLSRLLDQLQASH